MSTTRSRASWTSTSSHLGEKDVKNIAEPVTVYRVVLDDKATALVTPLVEVPVPRSRAFVDGSAAAALVVAVSALGALVWWQPWEPEFEPASVERMALPLPDKPSIAVLPFDNLSGDPEQAYFADGMTEDLITDLSQLSGIFVIARNSSWTYKDKPTKVQQVAEELGVRYVLEGSVRRDGDQVRINAQLIDALNGRHLWAERYDGSAGEVFALQDKVIRQIVAALAVNLTGEEPAQVADAETNVPRAYDAFLQGWDHLSPGDHGRHRSRPSPCSSRRSSSIRGTVGPTPRSRRPTGELSRLDWQSAVGIEYAALVRGAERQSRQGLGESHTRSPIRFRPRCWRGRGATTKPWRRSSGPWRSAPNEPDTHISKARILNATRPGRGGGKGRPAGHAPQPPSTGPTI